MMKKLGTALYLAVLFAVPAAAQQAVAQQPATDASILYFHPYEPALKGSFQVQPGQGFAIVEPFSSFVRMVQVCVRDTKSVGAMPVPTPMLATRTRRGVLENAGAVSVGSCALLEGESIAVGLADGTVDTDVSEENTRRQLSYMSGNYTILGYYSTTKPIAPVVKD